MGVIDARKFYGDLPKYAGSAYTISYINSMATLRGVRNYLSEQLKTGKVDPSDLAKAIQEFAVKNGDSPLEPWHLETVVRTNIQTAFSKGRYLEQKESENDYWQYFATVDGRETPLCHSLDGKVFKKEDPFWQNHYPPNHFNCRSTVVTLSEAELEMEDLKIEPDGSTFLDKMRKQFPDEDISVGKGFDNPPEKGLEKWLGKKADEFDVKPVKESFPAGELTKDEITRFYQERIAEKGLSAFSEHLLDNFSNMPDDLRKVYLSALCNANNISIQYSRGGNYHSLGKVFIERGLSVEDLRYVLFHETGHMVDHLLGFSNSAAGQINLNKLNDRILGSADMITKAQNYLFDLHSQSKRYWLIDGSVADIFSAVTFDKIGYGHSEKYWRLGDKKRLAEIFTNLNMLYSFAPELYKDIEGFFPELIEWHKSTLSDKLLDDAIKRQLMQEAVK